MKKIVYSLLVLVIFILLFYQTTHLPKFESYKSMGVEVMSVPKHTDIENVQVGDAIIDAMHIQEWKKYKNFDYDFAPSRIIINIDDDYVFWIDAWDESHDICLVSKRYGGSNLKTGYYRIPKDTVILIEEILDTHDLEWIDL